MNKDLEMESLQIWAMKGFLQEVKRIDNNMEDRRFAFILGAGASISSNIKGAATLANEWMEMIYHREHKSMHDDYQNWLESNPLKLSDWDPKNLAKHYPQIFEKCFEGDHDSGYAALEKAIKEGKPSLGYAVLAWILSSTRHRMVITTNFDNLVADAVSIYGGTYPHVIGHESLASYAKPLSRRPIVAKIHRDLFTDPINTTKGTGALEQSWNPTLKNIFKFYTPIFIGYGGNDGSLMNFLQDLDKKEILGRPFWCYYAPDGEPNEAIKQLLIKQNGSLVPIKDFDQLMMDIGLSLGYQLNEHTNQLKLTTKKSIDELEKNSKDFKNTDLIHDLNHSNDECTAAEWLIRINMKKEFEEKDKLFIEAITSIPYSDILIGEYARFLDKLERRNEARMFYKLALNLNSSDGQVLGNYATFLWNEEKLEEAEKYYLKALEVAPENATQLGNYAALLMQQKRLTKAEQYYQRSLHLEPFNGVHLFNYCKYLKDTHRHSEADNYYQEALKCDPYDADILTNYSVILFEQERYIEAYECIKEASISSPDNKLIQSAKKELEYILKQ
ncbi:tetratricopeptide repeat protein [Photobacterium leiognathi]|uniref:tetratricopeptide repeat protein n=1 Tax=Photobacterium leiognathi TaxID=553611 RepID=UPI00298106AF|nr:tetratricopeptide repeat protein [Photobacterium leiognathi]